MIDSQSRAVRIVLALIAGVIIISLILTLVA
jgi:hypothetical protein